MIDFENSRYFESKDCSEKNNFEPQAFKKIPINKIIEFLYLHLPFVCHFV